jgi:hypothetical protein
MIRPPQGSTFWFPGAVEAVCPFLTFLTGKGKMTDLAVLSLCRTVYDHLASRHILAGLRAGFIKTNKTEKEVAS